MPPDEQIATIRVLALLNRLSLNAFKAKSKDKLIFLMLNDTLQILNYQRAVLWDIEKEPQLLGVSGQVEISKDSALAQKWLRLVKELKNKGNPQKITIESFEENKEIFKEIQEARTQPAIQWIPVNIKDQPVLGFWLERWDGGLWRNEDLEVLGFLTQAYGAAWEHFAKPKRFAFLTKKKTLAIALIVLLGLIFIRVPLRVVAPMEVVPKNPLHVTAPVDGVIEEVLVGPGESVKKGQPLAKYDESIAEHELKAAQKQVEMLKAELHRANTEVFGDKPPPTDADQSDRKLSDISVLRLQLEREEVQLSLINSQLEKMSLKSPEDGIVVIENPDEWRGHPVRIGDHILIVTDPFESKIRIWIPESDNVPFDKDKTIKVFLNTNPENDLAAHLIYISDSSSVNAKGVPSYVAEADWVNPSKNVKIGLRGTAVLYGQDVSLLYLIIRRPWSFTRDFLGF